MPGSFFFIRFNCLIVVCGSLGITTFSFLESKICALTLLKFSHSLYLTLLILCKIFRPYDFWDQCQVSPKYRRIVSTGRATLPNWESTLGSAMRVWMQLRLSHSASYLLKLYDLNIAIWFFNREKQIKFSCYFVLIILGHEGRIAERMTELEVVKSLQVTADPVSKLPRPVWKAKRQSCRSI